MWFKELTGFEEISPQYVKDNIVVDGQKLISKVNNKTFQFGELEVVSLEELRKKYVQPDAKNSIRVSEIVADVQKLHSDSNNKNALFQAASQFNLLEMIGPGISPESGITKYENDYTQGPACAIACGAGTIYRNYFVPLDNQTGQTIANQIDCLEDIGKELKNKSFGLWEMRNGYALANQEGLLNINKQISSLTLNEREYLKGKLKVGIQWNTEVTIVDSEQVVSQVYCSALPVAYSHIESYYWENFARVILEATYEATFHAALINFQRTKSNKVFLTLIGGGAFGNNIDWILESLFKVVEKFKNTPLDIRIVSYGNSNNLLREVIEEYGY